LVGGWAEAEQALRDGRVDAAAVGAALTVTPGGLIPGPVYAHSDSAIITHQSTAPTRIWVLPKSPASQDLGRWCLPPCKAILTPQFKHDWALLKALQARRPDGVTGVAVARRYGAAMAAMDRDLVIHDGLGPSRPVRWWLAGEQWRKPVTIFFSGPRAHSLLTALQARYFDAPYQMRLRARPFVRSDLSRRLTPWDKLLRRAATRFRIDWRLLAAVMMRESGHDPQATSSAGARGIFQLMPNTAKMLRVKDATEPREAIPAAARYLRQLQDRYIDVINPHERRLFALAAYNAGPGHVDDARSLAASIGLADDRWWEGVGLSLPLLAQPKYGRAAPHGTCQGMVATRYAESVLALFDQYVQVVPESLHETDAGAPAR
jgi:membrane-bound lytic murein transglycosylase MltF